jgi:hypothetical protein
MLNSVTSEHTAEVLAMRHEKSEMIITRSNREWVRIAPQCGGMQGDACMPSEFREMYDQVVEELLEERGNKSRDCVVGIDNAKSVAKNFLTFERYLQITLDRQTIA